MVGAKRLRVREQIDRFQPVCFALCVIAVKNVETVTPGDLTG